MMFQRVLTIFVALFSIAAFAVPARQCAEFSRKIPNLKVALCERAQLVDMKARSVQGRPIWGRDMGAPNAPLRVLVLGGMHGDELSSTASVFHWMALAQQPTDDTAIHWRFVPAVNPDGLFSRPARRVNAHGVDLNRNFPTPNWAKESRIYWEQRTRRDPRRWPGARPLSEPESRFLVEQMENFQPNLIVSVHAPFGLLDFDGSLTAPQKLGRLYLDQIGIYPGSLGNFGGIHKGVPVVTIELPHATRTPAESELRQIWFDLLQWTQHRLGAGTPLNNTAADCSLAPCQVGQVP